jgi:hypothetical protein
VVVTSCVEVGNGLGFGGSNVTRERISVMSWRGCSQRRSFRPSPPSRLDHRVWYFWLLLGFYSLLLVDLLPESWQTRLCCYKSNMVVPKLPAEFREAIFTNILCGDLQSWMRVSRYYHSTFKTFLHAKLTMTCTDSHQKPCLLSARQDSELPPRTILRRPTLDLHSRTNPLRSIVLSSEHIHIALAVQSSHDTSRIPIS